jgi:hypothetical protein
MQPNNPNPHLDAMARQLGFPDYATWAAWEQHRQAGLKEPNTATMQQSQAQQPQHENVLQSILSAINPLQYVANRVGKVL